MRPRYISKHQAGTFAAATHDELRALSHSFGSRIDEPALEGTRYQLIGLLDEHFFAVRRFLAANGGDDPVSENSLRQLTAALHSISASNDLRAFEHHLEAHINTCPAAAAPRRQPAG